jgi:hypothetical protein
MNWQIQLFRMKAPSPPEPAPLPKPDPEPDTGSEPDVFPTRVPDWEPAPNM